LHLELPERHGRPAVGVDHEAVEVVTQAPVEGGHLCARTGGQRFGDGPQRAVPRVALFRSNARYFEPAGAVSWDVAMTATRPDWRVKFRRGDVFSITATYDSRRAAWWESMGIMIAYMADGGGGATRSNSGSTIPGGRPTATSPRTTTTEEAPAGCPTPCGCRTA
jgi:hypothetical protein